MPAGLPLLGPPEGTPLGPREGQPGRRRLTPLASPYHCTQGSLLRLGTPRHRRLSSLLGQEQGTSRPSLGPSLGPSLRPSLGPSLGRPLGRPLSGERASFHLPLRRCVGPSGLRRRLGCASAAKAVLGAAGPPPLSARGWASLMMTARQADGRSAPPLMTPLRETPTIRPSSCCWTTRHSPSFRANDDLIIRNPRYVK